MKLLPSDSFVIDTGKSVQEVLARVSANTEPLKWLRFSFVHKTYEGVIDRDTFSISRIILYRNIFRPKVEGRVAVGKAGTVVAIRMSLHSAVAIFMCFWFVGTGLVSLDAVILIASSSFLVETISSPPLGMVLVPLAMLVFGWLIMMAGFWCEAKRQKPRLIGLLVK